ncbi:uncharacterized protein A4U43_C07F23890, partial [Asparagus officinalis]
EEHCVAMLTDNEETCWGCGLRIILPSHAHIFKCLWCGAITNRNHSLRKPDSACFSRWRLIRDRSFVAIVVLFILFVLCAGVWAVHPIIFSRSYFWGMFHCIVTSILAICTTSSFCLAAFSSPGAPLKISWGSYSLVAKDVLDNYTFCEFCKKPKPPRAHHCRSCRMCVLDMDHHCPFIANCVGAGNHRSFIAFLISIVTSCIYIFMMTTFTAYHVWPHVDYRNVAFLGSKNVNSGRILKEIIATFASSIMLLSARGFVLVYLAFASVAVESGLSVLLWQQLHYVYEGNTYLNHINSTGVNGDKGCHNLLRFFGCPYSAFRFVLGPAGAAKSLESESLKLL